jgi:four helix bundle protein
MTEQEFKRRTKNIALRIIKLIESLPKTLANDVISKQLLRAGTSIGANYRAACRGKSTDDLLHKLAIVEEEADESIYWIELLIESGAVTEKKLTPLIAEINEIVAMTVASMKTVKERKSSTPRSKIQNLKSKI